MECLECDEECDFLDTITNRRTGQIECTLFVCRNEDCDSCGQIYNDIQANNGLGDPFGFY